MLYGCYELSSKSIRYCSGKLVHGRCNRLISCSSARQIPSGLQVSLRVTPGHRMLVAARTLLCRAGDGQLDVHRGPQVRPASQLLSVPAHARMRSRAARSVSIGSLGSACWPALRPVMQA